MNRIKIANAMFNCFFKLIYRMNIEGLEQIPTNGPGILITNHTSYIEGPMLYVLLYPRKMTALAKKQLWLNPFTRFFMKAWSLIPLDRGNSDRKAISEAMKFLDNSYFLGIAPEGTRSLDGKLLRGHRGACYFALQKRVPIYPIAQWGLLDWPRYIWRFKRCPVNLRVGKPFYIDMDFSQGRKNLQELSDQMMCRIAELLPEQYRGFYLDHESGMSFLQEI